MMLLSLWLLLFELGFGWILLSIQQALYGLLCLLFGRQAAMRIGDRLYFLLKRLPLQWPGLYVAELDLVFSGGVGVNFDWLYRLHSF